MDTENLIEKYFEKTLTNTELQEFENLLKSDSDFASEFNFQKNLKTALVLNERQTTKKLLQSFEKPKSNTNYKWLAAACVLVFMGIGTWFVLQNNNDNNLYQEYYQTYPNVIMPTVRGDVDKDEKTTAFIAYDQKNYQQAYTNFTALYDKNGEDYAVFYAALSLIELNKHKEAIICFDKKNWQKNNTFTPYVNWYKALCYIKLEENKQAKLLLESLAKQANPLQEQAKKLLLDLD
jgi:hypothetical protein